MAEFALRTEELTKRFGTSVALDSLSLEVQVGEVFGYLGPNGAGKTTTIRLLLGLARPSAGRASIFGLDVVRDGPAVHRRVAAVPGEVALWPSLTGEETLNLLSTVHGFVDDAYRSELLDRFELDPTRKVRTYSKGNRQKVILIAALASRADLLLFDEPTSGLDPLMEQVFRSCVAEATNRGQTIFLSSHILSEVEALCQRVGILRAGKLVDVGELAQMRHLAAVHVEMNLSGDVPDLSTVSGVSGLEVLGPVVRCQVTGSMAPLLAALEGVAVESLLSREPSLEELFLNLYGER